MPFVLTGNLETDTMCRFWMAEIEQAGGGGYHRISIHRRISIKEAGWNLGSRLLHEVGNRPFHYVLLRVTSRRRFLDIV
jgi:hypothetical protein